MAWWVGAYFGVEHSMFASLSLMPGGRLTAFLHVPLIALLICSWVDRLSRMASPASHERADGRKYALLDPFCGVGGAVCTSNSMPEKNSWNDATLRLDTMMLLPAATATSGQNGTALRYLFALSLFPDGIGGAEQ